ncbi:MAG: hypothetical protein WC489_04140 [Patescibacteria group bacterium]
MNTKAYSKLRTKYNFDDFTSANYRRLLNLAKKNFSFIKTDEIKKGMTDKSIFWRHDVDFSIHRAFKLAQIEHDAHVRTIYFIRLHSEFYNLFEKEIHALVSAIVSLNHDIGLHFDYTFYKIRNEKELTLHLKYEKNILEKLLGARIRAFSFHNPTEESYRFGKYRYAGLINTYSSYFRHSFDYCSDSNGYWRFRRLEDVITDKSIHRLHVLTHPEWWQDSVLAPKERIKRSITGRAEKQEIVYDQALKDYGRQNI